MADTGISLFERNIQRGVEAKIITLASDRSKITYHASRECTYAFNNSDEKGKKNPEELVRAAFFAELVLDYQYPAKRLDLEVKVPRRTPEDRADIVVYEDDDLKNPYLIVEPTPYYRTIC